MNPSPRQWVIGGLTTIVVAGGIVVGTVRSDGNTESFADTSAVTVTSEASTSSSSSSTSSTSTSSTTTTSTTTTTIAPVVTAPPAPPPPPPDPNDYTGCTSWSIDRINAVRAAVPPPKPPAQAPGPLTAIGGTGACSWALQLAKNEALSHSGYPCGGTGGQVVGYVGSTGGAVNPNAPAMIIQNWFDSRPHYVVLTHAPFTHIELAFVTRLEPNGSWSVWGVGNICP